MIAMAILVTFEVVQLKPRETVYRSDDFEIASGWRLSFRYRLTARQNSWIEAKLENV
jgi:hypothetical protein